MYCFDTLHERLRLLGVVVAFDCGCLVSIRCVVLVLNFHASVLANVHIVSVVFASCEVSLGDQVQIEGFVGLLLAVVDASGLLFGLGCLQVELNAVLVALLEQERGQSKLHQRLLLVLWVFSPV